MIYVAAQLDEFVRRHDLGEVNADIDNVVDVDLDSVYRPDVCFASKERLPDMDRGRFSEAADLVIEITSESTRYDDFGSKKKRYEANRGVQEYWILDIVREPMEAYLWYRRAGKFAGGRVKGPKLKSRLLKDFELNLKTVWTRALEGRE